jgi:hypothetical protein
MKLYQNLSLNNYPNEIWKDIVHYEGYYQISNLGRIKSIERKIISKNGILRKIKAKIIKQQFNHNNYLVVRLNKSKDY